WTRGWLRKLGPGLITGAADDDPSGIATYSQAGAQFGYQLGWTIALTYPLMVGIQMVSARMGRVTGHGLASNIRRHFPRPVLYAIVAMLVVANTINVAADIAAMGEALQLVAGSAAYAVAETFEWKSGLDLKLLEAREFYAIIALATLGGVALDFTPIDPIKGLFWSAVINGVIAVPIMVVMMLLADDPEVM